MANTPTSVYAFNKPAQGDTPWATTINGDLDSIDAEIARPRIPFNSPTVGATTTLDLSLARAFVFTVSQATTLAITNAPANTFLCTVTLIITNGSAFTLAFPASVSWLYGNAPVLQASGVDVIEMISTDGGVTWRARLLNGGYARVGASARGARQTLVLSQLVGLSTTSTSDASVTSIALQPNTLAANGQAIRITIVGRYVGANNGVVHLKFGATDLIGSINVGAASNGAFSASVIVVRSGATAQLAVAHTVCTTGSAASALASQPAETLSGSVTIDFRGSVATAGTLFYDAIEVEYLAF